MIRSEEYLMAISRQAVKEYMNKKYGFYAPDMTVSEFVEDLPSVTPKQKTGHWVRWYEIVEQEGFTTYEPHCKCSECNREYEPHIASLFNYCPNCGVRMVDIQKEKGENHDEIHSHF